MNELCAICDRFSELQKETLSTPSYRIRKEKKSGSLVFPKDVTVIALVENRDVSDQVVLCLLRSLSRRYLLPLFSQFAVELFAAMSNKWT